MRILGIDPGTATVGWGVIEVSGAQVAPVAFGHVSTSKDLALPDRLVEIASDLDSLLTLYRPDEAAVEELFFTNNQKTAISVGAARGAILLTLKRAGLSIGEYTPLEVKHALTNYGRADKVQVQQMVKTMLRLQAVPRPDDAADALAIALCHLSRRRMENLVHSR